LQKYTKISDSLLHAGLKFFLEANQSIEQLLLSNQLSNLSTEDKYLLASQIKLYPKALKKLPSFAAAYCFFSEKALEQASSEALAKYKSTKINGELLLDLSAGLGADDWAFSNTFHQVIGIDPDTDLNILVRKNFELLGITNVKRMDDTAETFLQQAPKADWVYLDADRRSGGGKAVHLFEGSPNVMQLLDTLPQVTNQVLLKLSPLVDLTHVMKNISGISRIEVVSLYNEVKEVLVFIKFGYLGNIEICATDINRQHKAISFAATHPVLASVATSNCGHYFYEPALSIIKSGLTAPYAVSCNLNPLQVNGNYLIGENLIPDFIGRVFQIKKIMPFKKSTVKDYLKSAGIAKANIARRDFKADVTELYSLFNLKEGGDEYLFFTTAANQEKIFVHGIRPC
jgi:hypothetical protein